MKIQGNPLGLKSIFCSHPRSYIKATRESRDPTPATVGTVETAAPRAAGKRRWHCCGGVEGVFPPSRVDVAGKPETEKQTEKEVQREGGAPAPALALVWYFYVCMYV